MHRLLSKRHKDGSGRPHHKDPLKNVTNKTTITVREHSSNTSSEHKFPGFFAADSPADLDEEPKIADIRKRVSLQGIPHIKDGQILFTLRSKYADGNVDRAFELLMLAEESWEGLLRDYKPTIKLLGSENRQGVTCWLDSLLFAMFSRLSSFEAILYNEFNDAPRKKLSMLLRLWVNMLRSGKLITTDITKIIQEGIAECGWTEAAELCQHDASEAFTFITEKLDLPLLTLKMDIYHTGKEDTTDDHKFINERLLEVAVPQEAINSGHIVTLEECLETYFNNRIEVKRFLERRSTLKSVRSFDSVSKADATHVETVELDASQASPTWITNEHLEESRPMSPLPNITPTRIPLRHRAPSIVQERFIPEDGEADESVSHDLQVKEIPARVRKGSVRKEVVMPAWQFFSLIPWYTDNAPTDDAQVASHFSSQRPILGICLKRYSYTPQGRAVRLNAHIDIPTEIGLPHFIKDDHLVEDAPLYGNFKLSLQSAVCHRGNSTESGHYISLVRGTAPNPESRNHSGDEVQSRVEDPKHWMRFDDLASERITLIDIDQALKEESPYLLFYQIVPIEGDPSNIAAGEKPPSVGSVPSNPESEAKDSGVAGVSLKSSSLGTGQSPEDAVISARPSFEVTEADAARGRSSVPEERRQSVTFSDNGGQNGSLTVAQNSGTTSDSTSRRGSKLGRGSPHGRSQSQTGAEMLSNTLSRLANKMSREKLPMDGAAESNVVIKEATANGTSTTDDPKGKAAVRKDARNDKHEKHKHRHGRNSMTLTKGKPEKPDRECVVM